VVFWSQAFQACFVAEHAMSQNKKSHFPPCYLLPICFVPATVISRICRDKPWLAAHYLCLIQPYPGKCLRELSLVGPCFFAIFDRTYYDTSENFSGNLGISGSLRQGIFEDKLTTAW